MNVIYSTKVKTIEQAIVVGAVRNECLEYMTHSQQRVGVTEQARWWFNFNGEAYLFWNASGWRRRNPVGYGTIQLQNNKYWVSGGLLPEFRGQGRGLLLFQHLRDCQPETWLEVFKTNERAITVYKKLGYIEKQPEDALTINGDIFIMCHRSGK